MIKNDFVKYRNILMIELKYLLYLFMIKEGSERKKERKRERERFWYTLEYMRQN